MMRGGDCLTCYRLPTCTETSIERVQTSYVCPLYDPVPESVYYARIDMMAQFGEVVAIRAMLDRPTITEGEEDGTGS